jgi:hypothetical protein
MGQIRDLNSRCSPLGRNRLNAQPRPYIVQLEGFISHTFFYIVSKIHYSFLENQEKRRKRPIYAILETKKP